jgi:hypothetical protein
MEAVLVNGGGQSGQVDEQTHKDLYLLFRFSLLKSSGD